MARPGRTARCSSKRAAAAVLLAALIGPQLAGAACEAERPAALVPQDPALCDRLDPVVRDPAGLPLGEYERTLGTWLENFCHRRPDIGWARDKRVRDIGPLASVLVRSSGTSMGKTKDSLIPQPPASPAATRQRLA